MANPHVRIEAIKARDMSSTICTGLDALKATETVPVTRSRALSCAHNPYADDDDIGLLLAYVGECCVGYLGLLPCLLKVGGNRHKVFFLSQWYVVPAHRKTAAGALLLMHALRLKHDLVMTGLSREAEKVFQTKTFKRMAPLEFSIVYMDALNVLGFPFYAMGKITELMGHRMQWLFQIAERTYGFPYPSIRRLLYTTVLNRCRHELESVDIEPLQHLEEDDVAPPCAPEEGSRFYRGLESVNWMLDYPWYTENQAGTNAGYFFGEYLDLFRYIAVRVRDKASGERIGTVVMSVGRRNELTVLKVLDLHVACPERLAALAATVLQYAREYRADRMFLPKVLAPSVGAFPLLRPLLVARNRAYYCCPKRDGSALTPVVDSIRLQIEDGDCAFS